MPTQATQQHPTPQPATGHTPLLPLKADIGYTGGRVVILDAEGNHVATTGPEGAKYLVTAANSHAALVAALEAASIQLAEHYDESGREQDRAVLEQLDAALSAARAGKGAE